MLVYVSAKDRARFVPTVTDLPGHWISNEGSSIDLGQGERSATPKDPTTSAFVLRKNSVAFGYAGGHGQFLHCSAERGGGASTVGVGQILRSLLKQFPYIRSIPLQGPMRLIDRSNLLPPQADPQLPGLANDLTEA